MPTTNLTSTLASGIVPTFTGCTPTAAGSAGGVPAPAINATGQNKYLADSGTFTTLPVMTGATSSTAGTTGVVPAPTAGQQNYVLSGGGAWSVVGSASYMHAIKAAAQSGMSNATAVTFDTITSSGGTDISLNTTTGVFTLNAGKTYRLYGTPGNGNTSGARLGYIWRNVTTSTDIGTSGNIVSPTDAYASDPGTQPAIAVVQATVSTQVILKVDTAYTGGGSAPGSIGGVNSPVAMIDVLAGSVVGTSNMAGASATGPGTAGLVPPPATGQQGYVLSGAGTWVAGTSAMTGATSGAAGTAGSVPAPTAGQQGYVLSGAGTWVAGTSAVIETINQTAHGFTVGQIIYYSGTVWALASTSTQTLTSGALGVVSSVIDANDFVVTTSGLITGLSGLTAGQAYALSSTAGAGQLASAASATTTGYTQIYSALSTTTAIVNPITTVGAVQANNGQATTIVSGSTTTSSTYVTIPGATFSLTNTGIFNISASLSLINTPSGYGASLRLYNVTTGVAVPNTVNEIFSQAGQGTYPSTLSQTPTWQISNTGTNAYSIQWVTGSNQTLTITNTATNASIIYWNQISGFLPIGGMSVDYANWSLQGANVNVQYTSTSAPYTGNVKSTVASTAAILPLAGTGAVATGTIPVVGNTFKVNTSGTYVINASIAVSASAAGSDAFAQIVRNGVTVLAANDSAVAVANDQTALVVIWTGPLSGGDTIDIRTGELSTNTLIIWDGNMTINQVSSAATTTFAGATATVAGTPGFLPAPAAGAQNRTLTGAGTFATNVPAFASGAAYNVGDCVWDPVSLYLYQCLVAHTASTTLALDTPLTNWQSVGNFATATGAIAIGGNQTTGNLTIGGASQTGTLALQTGTGAINIGTTATAKTVTVGSATAACAFTVASGAGAINIGNDSVAKAIYLGNTTGNTSILMNCGTGNLVIGGAATSTITIGNSITTGTLLIGTSLTSGTVEIAYPNHTGNIYFGSSSSTTTMYGSSFVVNPVATFNSRAVFYSNVQIGNTAPGTILFRVSRADTYVYSGQYEYVSGTGTGNITTNTGSVAFGLEIDNRILCHSEIDVTSDRRAKELRSVIDPAEACDLVMKIPTVAYGWTDGRDDTSTKIGHFAQDVGRAGLGEAVAALPTTTPDGRKWGDFHTLDKDTMLAVLWSAVQGLRQRIDVLEGREATPVSAPISLEEAMAEGMPIF